MTNFWKMKDFSLFSVPYVYVDHKDYLADILFRQNNVSLKFNEEFEKEDTPYRVIFCKVMKKDAARFEEVLSRLNNKMLLMGYHDYPDICDEVNRIMEMGMKARKKA